MTGQLDLLLDDDDVLARERRERRLATIEARFRTFHAEHPNVYRLLVRFSRQARDRGYHKLGIGLLYGNG